MPKAKEQTQELREKVQEFAERTEEFVSERSQALASSWYELLERRPEDGKRVRKAVEDAFDFAAHLLERQRDFTISLLETVVPTAAEKTKPAQPKKAAKPKAPAKKRTTAAARKPKAA